MAVRSVLEDHETAILEVERQVRVRDVETFAAVVDTMETRVQETQKVVAELGKKLEKSVRDLTKQSDSKVTELEDDLELRVDEIAKSVRWLNFRSWHVPSRTWSDGVMRSRIVVYDLLKIVSRTWSHAGLEGCTASPGRDTNTGCSGWSRLCDHAAAVPAVLRVLRASGSVPRQKWWTFQLHADLGTHSAHCAADCGDLTGTVLGSVVDAPIVVQRQVPWLGRAMLGSTMDTCHASSRVAFGRFSRFTI